MTVRPCVQFVTYEASRTGSPLLLLRFLRWLRDEGSFDLDVVCWRGGPLVDEFAALAPTRALGPLGGRTIVETVAVGAGEVGLTSVARRVESARLALALRGGPRPDLLYLNGVPSFAALPHLRVSDEVPVLGHVHELQFALRRSLPADQMGLLSRPDRFVVVSEAVAANLVDRHGIDRNSIAVCRGFVDDEASPVAEDATRLRERLDIPIDAAVVGAMGDLIWRKGPDLFLQLAAAVLGGSRTPGSNAPHFVWVGGRPGQGCWDEVVTDIKALGLADRVHMVGDQTHPADWHHLFDVFALTSREDPFPLVLLEAAQAGTPAVAFSQGGAPELLAAHGADREAGWLVAPLDVVAMAEAVAALLNDDAWRNELGQRGRTRVARRLVTSVGAPALLAEIKALLS